MLSTEVKTQALNLSEQDMGIVAASLAALGALAMAETDEDVKLSADQIQMISYVISNTYDRPSDFSRLINVFTAVIPNAPVIDLSVHDTGEQDEAGPDETYGVLPEGSNPEVFEGSATLD